MTELQGCDCQLPDILQTTDLTTCLKCGSTRCENSDQLDDDGLLFRGRRKSFDELLCEDSDVETTGFLDDSIIMDAFESDKEPELQNKGALQSRKAFVHEGITQKKEIRLLQIQQGDWASNIHCTISHEVLSHVLPPYEAISYTWADETGDTYKKEAIWLNSKRFMVTANCERALRRARLKDRNRMVWIDAICINQESVAERSHQVQLMAQIYARASAVLIYIGEARGRSTELLDILGNRRFTDSECETSVRHEGLALSLSELLSRPYFWRVWVLQEIALARKAIMICGGTSISWSLFTGRSMVSSCPNLVPILSQPTFRRPFRQR